VLEHPSNASFNVQNPLTKPKHRSSNLVIEVVMSKRSTKLQEINPQAKSFLTFQASMEVKFKEREVVRNGGKYGCKMKLEI